jgi:peptide deformylase
MDEIKMCPHGRDVNQMCPHCLGTNETIIDKPIEEQIIPTVGAALTPEPTKEPVVDTMNEAANHMIMMYPVLKKIVPAHNNKSRLVLEEDIEYVSKQAQVLHDICMVGAYAMHHSQIESDDPMNFFVTKDRKIVINPKITRHSNYFADSKEGCMSFLDKEQVIVPRWQKCEVEYQTIMVDPENKDKFKLSSVIEESLSGRDSHVFQHELDHGDAKFIYQL